MSLNINLLFVTKLFNKSAVLKKIIKCLLLTNHGKHIYRNKVYNQLMALYPKYACKQFLENLPLLSLYCDYSENNIPQVGREI